MKTKILYLDDEHINLKLFEINFKRKYEVFTAPDANQGLVVLDSHADIALVISDMKMPGMNGIEFITIAKTRYPAKKYYILTGFDITNDIQNAIDTGLILHYFSKPIKVSDMEIVLDKALKM